MFCIFEQMEILDMIFLTLLFGIIEVQVVSVSVIYEKIYISIFSNDVDYRIFRIPPKIYYMPKRVFSTRRELTYYLEIVR